MDKMKATGKHESNTSSSIVSNNIEINVLSQRVNSIKSTLTSSMTGSSILASSKTAESNINNTTIHTVLKDFNNPNLTWPDLLSKYAALSGIFVHLIKLS